MKQEVLDKFVGEMLDLLKSAKSFTMEQVPLVAQEILAYSLAQAVLYICLGIIFIGLFYVAHRLMHKFYEKEKESDIFMFYMPASISAIVGIVFFIYNLLDLLKITLAPRLYLIEYLSKLLKH